MGFISQKKIQNVIYDDLLLFYITLIFKYKQLYFQTFNKLYIKRYIIKNAKRMRSIDKYIQNIIFYNQSCN